MNDKTAWISEAIDELRESGLFNVIRTIESPIDGQIIIGGRRLLNFCTNNYLGLANHPRVREAAAAALSEFGVGPTAVRSIAGTMTLHVELEERLAAFKRAEGCISFQSGFSANLATIPALVGRGDVIFSDELNHASIIDGCRLSRAQVIRYRHADAEDLRRMVRQSTGYDHRLIVSDGVFSMDGDIAPLDKISEVAEEYGILLMVDDAHGEGVLGEGGRGIVDHFGLHGTVDIEVGTLSKAFGVVGGFAAGSQPIVDWLRQRARPFLFSSAMTVPDVAACLEALTLLEESSELVEKLWINTETLREGMERMGFDTGKSSTPIVPVMLGEARLAQAFSSRLFERGLFATAIAYPTVPRGQARIRVMNSAAHTDSDLAEALEAFREVGEELGVI